MLWGVLLMAQAASRSFADLAVLRTLSGAFEATADPAFVQELKRLDLDQLCFLAKGYDVPGIAQQLQANCLQIFMLTHKATVDEDARKFVTAGVKGVGGRFLEIFENARQKQSGDFALQRRTSLNCT